jgi:hypothetical protein
LVGLALLAPRLSAEELTPEQVKAQIRSGWPMTISCLAHPSESPHDIGYQVGGGKVCGGRGPMREGTWGWDFGGCLFSKRVVLAWGQGPHLGKPPTYKINGPRLLPE